MFKHQSGLLDPIFEVLALEEAMFNFMDMDGLVAGYDHKRDIISLPLCVSLFL